MSSSSSSPSSSSSSSSAPSYPLPSSLPSSPVSPLSSPFSSTPPSNGSSPDTLLTPNSYLARLRACPTSVENEIWDAAHRLYRYLTLSPSSQTRATCFRRLVRLCLAHHDQLLGPVEAAIAGSASPATTTQQPPAALTACPICRTSCTASSRCCWFLPDQREQGFLALLVSLCRDHAALFGDDVSPEQFQASFLWE